MTPTSRIDVVATSREEALWLATLQRALARASHDVKDALNGVSVNLEVIRSRAARPGVDAAAVAPFADAAGQQLERLTNLLEAVLALGRAEREPVDVGLVLRRVAVLCSASASTPVEVTDERAGSALGAGPGSGVGEESTTTSARGDVVRLALVDALLDRVGGTTGSGATSGPVRCTLSGGRDAVVVTIRAAGRRRGGVATGGMPGPVAESLRSAGVRWSVGDGTENGEELLSLVFPRA